MIVCYLHGQIGRFTFWEIANKSGLIRPITEKRQRRPETGISDGFEEVEHEFPLGAFRFGKTELPFQNSRCSLKFSIGTILRLVFRLLFDWIFRKPCK